MPGRKTLALLVNDVFGAYQAAFRSAIERAAARSGCGLLVFSGRSLGHPDPYERAQNRLYDWVSPRVADGAIVLSGTVAHFADRTAMAGLCARLGAMPVVSIALEIPGVPSILMENRSALSESVSHVALHHRRRRIAYIGGPLGNEEARDRLAGYHDALRACNLPLDEQLVTAGLFTLPSGAACMEQMVGRDVPFDAVVAANDQMAIGAMDVLRALGVRVPEEVVVVGFDDTPIAQFAARALTTIAQPIERMGEAGVEAVLAQIAGRSAAAKMSFDGHLVLRESCGCSYKNTRSAISLRPPQSTAADYARQNRERLIDEASPSSEPTAHRWRARWAPRLIDALTAELAGDTGAFLIEIEQTGDEARGEHASLEEIGRFVASLQALFDDAGYRGAREFELEQLWISARAIVSTAISRAQARAALIQVEGSVDLRYVTQRISIAFDTASLAAELERSLPQLGVDWAYVALRSKDAGGSLRPLVALEGGARASWPAQPYPAAQLFPGGGGGVPRCVLLWAITFEHEILGLVALGGSSDPLVGEAVRAQLGAALKMGELHARVVEQTTLQERFAREQLTHEMETARRIQTALAPSDLRAPGLQVAAETVPAADIGGDYYDVLPVAGGCWLGIGDVAGHGLMSGLIMMTIQTIVRTLVDARPDADPAALVVDVNRLLVTKLHHRLRRGEHATFTLLRVFRDGRVRFAGAHEPIVVWRAATRTCELVETEGTWLGLVADIREATVDREIVLSRDDLLVLFSDGLSDARNARDDRFGLEAICRIVEAHAMTTPDVVHAELITAVRAWAPALQDDVTCVVVRFTGLPAAPQGGEA